MRKLLSQIARMVTSSLDVETLPWAQLRYPDAMDIRQQLTTRYAPATCRLALSALRGVLNEAWRLGQISRDELERAVDLAPVRGSGRRLAHILDPGQIKRLLNSCKRDRSLRGQRDLAILSVLYGAGLRRAELSSLSLVDVQQDTLAVCGKGRQYRLVYLPQEAAGFLWRWINVRGQQAGPLFVRIHRSDKLTFQPLSTETIARVVRKRAVAAGIGVLKPHDLRRAMATHLLGAGVDILLVQRILRHRSVSTTTIYDRRSEIAQRAAANRLFRFR